MVMTTMHKSPIRTTRPDDQIEDQVVHGDGLFTTHIRMWDVSPGSWIKKWWGVSMVSRVTGRNVRDEVSSRSITTNFDLLLHIRKMRLKWLGDILRNHWGSNNLLMHAVCMQHHMKMEGNILMDAPRHETMDQLTTMARDKAFWQEHLRHTWENQTWYGFNHFK